MQTFLVTGAAGFIGGNFVLRTRRANRARVISLDALTYAGNRDTLSALEQDPEHIFVHGSINDRALVDRLLSEHQPDAIINFAAESHVDRSIDAPTQFIETNVVGTLNLLLSTLGHYRALDAAAQARFRFLHVSTDEVYGSLGATGKFTEETAYRPNSPYSASKAASDHLVRAYHHTFGLPTLTTNCSNNYGPYQFPEKLIPLMIFKALNNQPLPVYGDGQNVRDWLFVEDHCSAIECVLAKGTPGEIYNVGGDAEMKNIDVVHALIALIDRARPRPDLSSRRDLIAFVGDRPGHDRRYAIDSSKLQALTGWRPSLDFDEGLKRTVDWYLNNSTWTERILSGAYRGERLGV